MLANLAIVVVRAALPLALLYLIKLVFDGVQEGITSGELESALTQVTFYIALAGGIALVQSFFSSLATVAGDAQAQLVSDYMYGVLHSKSIEVDLGYYETPSYRDTLFRAQQQAPFRPNAIVSGLREIARNGLSLVIMAGLLMSLHWAIVPILILVSAPGVVLRLKYARKVYDRERSVTAVRRMTNYVNQMVSSARFAKEVRLFSLGGTFQDRFGGLRQFLRREQLRMSTMTASAEFIGEIISVIGMYAVITFMLGEALSGAITIGGLVMYYQAMQRAWGHFGAMLRGVSSLYEHSLFLRDLFEFLDIKPSVVDPAKPKPVPRPISEGITLEHVTFQYPGGDRPVLNDFNLTIRKGEHIAIVGRNGSGKTTLIKLLCRLYDPCEGTVRIDGIDMREFKVSALRRELGVLVQDFVRYQESAFDNIRYGKIDHPPNERQIVAAARLAGADEFINALPQGYDSILGTTFEESWELSVGQWQRLALARTILRDGQIVILDEPTSSMDSQSAATALKGIREGASDRTTIVISHRLSTVQSADRIVLLEDGQIKESGTHTELVELGGSYARLFEFQSLGLDESDIQVSGGAEHS